jgi:hypothetical protein
MQQKNIIYLTQPPLATCSAAALAVSLALLPAVEFQGCNSVPPIHHPILALPLAHSAAKSNPLNS